MHTFRTFLKLMTLLILLFYSSLQAVVAHNATTGNGQSSTTSTVLDVGISGIITPFNGTCHGNSENVIVALHNYSSTTHDFAVNPVTISVQFSGTITTIISTTISTGTITGNNSINITVGQINTSVGGLYNMTATTSTAGDLNTLNNSATASFLVTILSVNLSAVNTVVCEGTEVTLTANVTNGKSPFLFAFNGNGNQSSATYTSGPLSGTSIFSVVCTDVCGNTATASIVIVVNPLPQATVTPQGPVDLCSNGFDSPLIITLLTDPSNSILWNDFTSSVDPTIYVFNNDPFLIANNNTYNFTAVLTSEQGCTSETSVLVNLVDCNTSVTFNCRLFLQGFYQNPSTLTPMDNFGNGGCLFTTGYSTDPNEVDSITISAIDPLTLNVMESNKAILTAEGSCSTVFTPALVNQSYYISIGHRNSIETWSADPVFLTTNTFYDFTDAVTKAYGNNMTEVEPGVWAIYSGDIADSNLGIGGKDNVIESTDYSEMENALIVFLTGYVVQDITGDGVVESSDYSLIENNISGFILSIHP